MCVFCSIREEVDDGTHAVPPDGPGGPAADRDVPAAVPPAGGTASRSRNWSGPFRKTPGRLAGMAFIRLYQLTLSGFIGNSCRHLPTCSEYGYEAIARHGLWRGGFLTLFRVARCGPGGTSGFDPVPERLAERYAWWAPWRLWR
ncbi:membrane protein insertion efficiency factor YidD [Mycoplana sp. MJR14]|uniref:membrane protein insertion efficiency factor YidD n=1 Tax=Mycoplana sp. MJR14 TaxID=3032583 RepID=UPI0023DC8C5C|nr:membrane protein insertion efficiency factor YidD [Mycoplana sp. MJR14]MDF1634160.1 membrane protein insertion efficiency factor YidD [Mycoplana sp. MJR14]